MTKSIHFNQTPNMRGKLTMPFTDVMAENFRPKENDRIHRQEMRDWEADVYTAGEAEFQAYLSNYECRGTA